VIFDLFKGLLCQWPVQVIGIDRQSRTILVSPKCLQALIFGLNCLEYTNEFCADFILECQYGLRDLSNIKKLLLLGFPRQDLLGYQRGEEISSAKVGQQTSEYHERTIGNGHEGIVFSPQRRSYDVEKAEETSGNDPDDQRKEDT
jgi:hypothetical protein